MTINRKLITIIFFVLFILFNLSIKFNNYTIRQIISIPLLFFAPGFLFLLFIKFKSKYLDKLVLYSVVFSITALISLGLLINIFLPLFGILRPLTSASLLLSFNIFMIILSGGAFIRSSKFKIIIPTYTKDNFPQSTIIYSLLCIFTPFISVFGTILLNNNKTNIIVIVTILLIFIQIIIAGLKRKVYSFEYPLYIYVTAFSILLMLSLRSWHISGWDINEEYKIFQITQSLGKWSIENINHTYNSCLSITILPTVISLLTSINPEYVFKFVYQLLFAFTPVLLYLIAKNFVDNKTSYFASIYFISQPMFIQPMTAIMRQEIAFLFSGLLFLILLDKSLSHRYRFIFFVITSFSLITSHYSTTYITLIILILLYLCIILSETVTKILNIPFLNKIADKSTNTLSFPLLLILFLGTFIWNVQLTKSTGNITYVIRETFSNITNIFREDMRSKEVYGYLVPNYLNKNISQENIDKYLNQLKTNHLRTDKDYYLPESYSNYTSIILGEIYLPSVLSTHLSNNLSKIIAWIKSLTKILLIPTYIYLCYIFIKKSYISSEYFIIYSTSIGLIVIIMIVPMLSQQYNIDRLYLQVMFFLSTMIVSTLIACGKFLSKKTMTFSTTLIISVYFLINTNIQNQLIGGYSPLTLHNFGTDYDKFYLHKSEIISAHWLSINKIEGYPVVADRLASLKLQGFSDVTTISQIILPQVIPPNSYVFTSFTNNIQGRTWIKVNERTVSIQTPNEFLDTQKNEIYNNNSVKIYK